MAVDDGRGHLGKLVTPYSVWAPNIGYVPELNGERYTVDGPIFFDGRRTQFTLDEDESEGFGYIIDLGEESTGEWVDDSRQWIMGMPIGNYTHPRHGAINITVDRIQHYTEQIKNRLRGQDLNVDYDHKEGVAAGWIKDADPRSDGLWILVEWTATAAKHIKDKAYRYFSPEIHLEWQHPATKKIHNDVLFGGALTNRPFLKGIQPITLNEDPTEDGEISMGRKQLEALAKKLGVKFTDDMSDSDLQAKVVAASTADDDSNSDDDNTDDVTNENDDSDDSDDNSDAEDQELVKLAEDNPVIANMLSEQRALRKTVAKMAVDNKRNEIKIQLSELDTDKAQLSPKASGQLSSILMKVDDDVAGEILKFAEGCLGGTAVIQLREIGGSTSRIDLGDKTAEETWDAKIKELTEGDDGMTYDNAAVYLAETNTELYEAYEAEMIGGTD